MTTRTFDLALNALSIYDSPKAQIIELADTCEIAARWFLDHDLKPTAADVLRFAEIVLARWDAEKQKGGEE